MLKNKVPDSLSWL